MSQQPLSVMEAPTSSTVFLMRLTTQIQVAAPKAQVDGYSIREMPLSSCQRTRWTQGKPMRYLSRPMETHIIGHLRLKAIHSCHVNCLLPL